MLPGDVRESLQQSAATRVLLRQQLRRPALCARLEAPNLAHFSVGCCGILTAEP